MYTMLLNLGCIIPKYLHSCADCNYTIGISVIDNFVGYIQESIDERSERNETSEMNER